MGALLGHKGTHLVALGGRLSREYNFMMRSAFFCNRVALRRNGFGLIRAWRFNSIMTFLRDNANLFPQ